MEGFVQIGPMALATDRLLVVGIILLFIIVLDRITLRQGVESSRVTGLALFAAVVIGRAVFVARHWTAFAADPASIVAVWQGGFDALGAALGAALVIVWRLRPGRAMWHGLLAVAMLWGAWLLGSTAIEPVPRPLPPLPALASSEGVPFDAARITGRPFVLNLWATWCPPCRRELPMLADVARQSDVPVLLVNQGEAPEKVAAYLREAGVRPDNVLLDRDAALMRGVGGGALPLTLFVDRSGRIVRSQVGEISRATLEAEMAQLRETAE